MARILVTGSAQGIGRQTAADLVGLGHEVVVHGRDDARGRAALDAVPGAAGVVVGDLSSLASTRALAQSAGAYDVVVHNAGVGGDGKRETTVDGLSRIFQVNVLAPYVLTALLPAPQRAIYLSSGLQASGRLDLDDPQWERRRWDGMQAYCDSKLADVLLALWVARRSPGTVSNAVDPGWIRTAMGGRGAPGSPEEGADTQVWLATSDEPAAVASGRYLKGRREQQPNPAARDERLQDRLVELCARLSGVAPAA
ncbi:NAD(P)-dependent dehydrogenase (short-subunit alcohol dehydrogenase family) [Motilibacter rhizosphaerae]|uniref:NAD(P)-dependent dehydrogenase (Short-subunit alcohol dehydrogenase family) n=1 Tax=Motilibacter rhizosphaerae TaxID=598652 RepID=A0A4Q7NX12_9ACTN|nr:SDR family NAD(P)-dependent oxidoreductase [Motilibacter rhizosphaerae]RZS90942.1 NAD(P)-dependent dehydrogenase (short-subunit alcohol dehydrogenase family) [Motilibacter rhizosphaerae]